VKGDAKTEVTKEWMVRTGRTKTDWFFKTHTGLPPIVPFDMEADKIYITFDWELKEPASQAFVNDELLKAWKGIGLLFFREESNCNVKLYLDKSGKRLQTVFICKLNPSGGIRRNLTESSMKTLGLGDPIRFLVSRSRKKSIGASYAKTIFIIYKMLRRVRSAAAKLRTKPTHERRYYERNISARWSKIFSEFNLDNLGEFGVPLETGDHDWVLREPFTMIHSKILGLRNWLITSTGGSSVKVHFEHPFALIGFFYSMISMEKEGRLVDGTTSAELDSAMEETERVLEQSRASRGKPTYYDTYDEDIKEEKEADIAKWSDREYESEL